MSQALIAACLALSILTFVISLIEILPMREGDVARQESLQHSSFICLVVPIVLTYCSQSNIIVAFAKKVVLLRPCTLKECLSIFHGGAKMGEALAYSGLSCLAAPLCVFGSIEDCNQRPVKINNQGIARIMNEDILASGRLVTNNITLRPDAVI